MVFKPSTTAMREIEPTVIEQIQPTKMFLPEIAITPTVQKAPRVIEEKQNAPRIIEEKKEEVKEETVNEVKVKEVKEEEVDELKEENQGFLIPEVKEEKQKAAKALFQETKIVKEEVVPVTESVSYEDEEEEEDDEDEDEIENQTEKIKERGNIFKSF